ncbi:MAG: peptidase M64 N-terminal domain-containing protein, partial [Prevotellaceae bacterium]|nr:peptidase M64 N-terminal domain-containing protein [Prevotellaceae bacterium]
MRRFLLYILFLMLSFPVMAQDFNQYFEDATLRLDYIMAGNDHEQHIYLEDLKRQEKWAGRRSRLAEKFLNGNGQLTVKDHETQKVIYVWTFSTLFQEWQLEAEAKTVNKAFETSYNI